MEIQVMEDILGRNDQIAAENQQLLASKGVFAGLPAQFTVNRYHSLAIARDSLPPELKVTAQTEDGEIMGIRHRDLPIEGVQFHPESVLSEHGHALLQNFLK